ncbi:hypothetical protein HS048_36185 [Planomonospora sp. ID91781]|uniref:Hisitidine kinase n=3 Tax=Planomonospora TaxID=1998 RepID=A0A161LYW4_9ACTN|nr:MULTISPECIES: hypothetical protein [Planomonospora]MBG0826108.1 hypothetical protein [Planomonospora sp. ID91781]GAT71119.1 hisitidine kinase [Planomonospora sphaerica]GGK95854.1 hypothetical protein GCM10010126_64040 [Planomonospora parontospora]GII12995.1 hypothetical protein Ppa06_67930 [Planomonospora parontospora subsp. parontospora]
MSTLPAPKAIKDLFEDMLGRGVTVGITDPAVAESLRKAVVALYVDNSRKLTAVVGFDLHLASFAGAAIGLIPVGGAEASIEDGELTPMLSDNVREICNILTGLLNQQDLPHLKLYEAYMPGEAAPADATSRLLALGARLDLKVDIAGYGSGRFWLSLAG